MGTEPVVDQQSEQSEVEAKWGDKSIKAKSKYMSELIAFLCLALLIGLAIIVYQHQQDTRERDREFLASMKERNSEITAVFKEMTVAQRDMVAAQREQNCLIAIPQDARGERAAFCKTLAR